MCATHHLPEVKTSFGIVMNIFTMLPWILQCHWHWSIYSNIINMILWNGVETYKHWYVSVFFWPLIFGYIRLPSHKPQMFFVLGWCSIYYCNVILHLISSVGWQKCSITLEFWLNNFSYSYLLYWYLYLYENIAFVQLQQIMISHFMCNLFLC